MALLAVLPYDSLHRKNDGAPWSKGRFLGTISALLHWLGSPQTALTSTLFNIHQVRKCFHATLPSGSGISGSNRTQHLKKDAYYVLSCIGQFKLPKATEKPCLDALLYGLFRPFVGMDAGEAGVADAGILLQPIDHPGRRAEMWTTELVQEMAFQLRMLRRRGVYPAFVSVFCSSLLTLSPLCWPLPMSASGRQPILWPWASLSVGFRFLLYSLSSTETRCLQIEAGNLAPWAHISP
jgi:hypothetical protein